MPDFLRRGWHRDIRGSHTSLRRRAKGKWWPHVFRTRSSFLRWLQGRWHTPDIKRARACICVPARSRTRPCVRGVRYTCVESRGRPLGASLPSVIRTPVYCRWVSICSEATEETWPTRDSCVPPSPEWPLTGWKESSEGCWRESSHYPER